MAKLVNETLAENDFDLLIASQLAMASYVLTSIKTPAFLEELEIGSYFDQIDAPAAFFTRARRKLMWLKLSVYLRDILPRFATVITVSKKEQILIGEIAPNYRGLTMIPNCIDLPYYAGFSVAKERSTLVFTGAFTYQPNYEAMLWFIGEVYPLVRACIHSVQLIITGDHANLDLPSLENVILTGFVDDVRPIVAGATVSVVPILHGSGTRLKILESMALGTPIVTTSKGVEGISACHEEHLLICDTVEAFAMDVVRLIREPLLADELAKQAYNLVREHYDCEPNLRTFRRIISNTVGDRPQHNRLGTIS